MRAFTQTFILAAVFCLTNHFLSAQDQQGYYAFDYMKVEPGMHDEYLKLEKVWKKIHQANIEAGKYNFWELTGVAYPSGAGEAYHYVTRINFRGEKQLAEFIENWQFPDLKTILSPEETALVNRTSEIRTLVKSEIWAHEDFVVDEDMSNHKVLVFNFFDYPATGSWSEHARVEKEIWKPVHDARRKDGQMKGWVLVRKVLPGGSAQAYFGATVDLYTNMEQFLSQANPIPYFEKVHAGKDFEKLFAETDAACDLVRQEVRIVLDDSNKMENAASK